MREGIPKLEEGILKMTGRTTRTVTLLTFAMVAMLITAIVAQVTKNNIMITGVVSCSFCAGNHSMRVRKGPNQDHGCTRTCIIQGSHYVLAREGQLYELKGDLHSFEKFAGQRVTVTGTMSVVAARSELNVLSIH